MLQKCQNTLVFKVKMLPKNTIFGLLNIGIINKHIIININIVYNIAKRVLNYIISYKYNCYSRAALHRSYTNQECVYSN